jgi:hypothetical protein
MVRKYMFFLLLAVISISANAQLHLGESPEVLVASLGSDNTKVYDEHGNEVIAYVNEVKQHPKFGDFTLYSLYVFENNTCVMQQTLLPLSQKDDFCNGFNSLYEKVDESVWKSKDEIYYVLVSDKETLRMQVMREEVFNRDLR